MRIRAKHYITGTLCDIVRDRGRIVAVEEPASVEPDRMAPWVAPAFFDLQVNGCDGVSFNAPDLTVEGVHHVVAVCRRHGIGGMLPTLVTNSFNALAHGFQTLARACDDPALARVLPGFHLEGPYISGDDGPRGAHPREHVRPPNSAEFRRLQDAAGGRIRLVTLAPEHEGATRFIEERVREGVVVAIGHTAATAAQIHDAIRAGARLSTHLGNGSHAILPRHPNYIWEQLAADELWASLICDGHHLPTSVAKCIIRVKTPARAILTCDASPLAGSPPGRYRLWGHEFEVQPNGKVVVPGTPYLAGSGAFTDHCVATAIRDAGLSLAEAVDMAGARPRELLGLPPLRLEPGMPDDVILFDWSPDGELSVHCQ